MTKYVHFPLYNLEKNIEGGFIQYRNKPETRCRDSAGIEAKTTAGIKALAPGKTTAERKVPTEKLTNTGGFNK